MERGRGQREPAPPRPAAGVSIRVRPQGPAGARCAHVRPGAFRTAASAPGPGAASLPPAFARAFPSSLPPFAFRRESCWFSKPNVWGEGGLSLRCRSSKLGVPDVGYECFALQGQALGLRVPSPWWGPARVAVAVCRDCVSLLPAWMWPFSRLPCVKLLLSWLRVFFRGNCSVCRCSFSVPTGGGEFREVFCCHFESPLVLTVKTTSRSRHRPTWS